MYLLYSVCLFLFFLPYLPLTFIRRRIFRKEKIRLIDRLGGNHPAPSTKGAPVVWIHAVSVGEILSLQGLIKRIRRDFPEWTLYISTLTETGYRAALDTLTEADRIFFLPFDFAFLLKRLFARLRPDVLVLTESELWPNLLRVAGRRARAVLVINGRISRGSFRNYRRMKPWIRRMLSPVTRFLVQTETDRKRLLELGLPDSRVTVAGNLKAEIDLPRLEPDERDRIRESLGIPAGAWVWAAGSTHRGEEEIILKAFEDARGRRKELRLILAPRHPYRAEEVEKIARSAGLRTKRRTTPDSHDEWDVLILDTIGELARIYAVSQAAFIGGSLIRHGGQNLLEPAFYGRPVFFGPHMDNFKALAELFVERGAARVIRSDPAELRNMFLLAGDSELDKMGRGGLEILASLQGALDRTVSALADTLSDRNPADNQKKERV